MIEAVITWVVELIRAMGYPGVFIFSALESTFLPIPSEATLIPAGYLIHQGEWNGPLVFVLAVAGSLFGSLLNYFLAVYCGRFILLRYGRYFFMDETKLGKVEAFFAKYGPLSIFSGRLVLGVRHFISFPAGLAKMNLWLFSLYTVLGAGLWTLILLVIGYLIGDNKDLISSLLPALKIGFLVVIGGAGAFYYRHQKKRAKLATH